MCKFKSKLGLIFLCVTAIGLSACATSNRSAGYHGSNYYMSMSTDYSARMPESINTHGEKVVVVDPNVHAWGAYDREGKLVKGGIATAGGNFCEDIGRPCRTASGSFRVQSLGDGMCKSKIYPKPNGGGLMPYCMFFHNGMAMHGSLDGAVVEDNISHGCVRMRIPDAEWLRYNFVSVGTKVVVKPY